uniref:Plasmodium yoelii subtelomeric region (PYST-C1) n=1 Tax=Meloidogyne hapla TaxID=6305 RepID=A0A1I8BIH4_MELHA
MLTKLVLLLLLVSKVKLDNKDDLIFNELSVKDNNKEINNKNNYLSYNLKSNNSDLQTIEILSLNYNETYEELLSKISNNCISTKELKELHKDKSTFIFSSILFPFLLMAQQKKLG